jgi:hypothetical protein
MSDLQQRLDAAEARALEAETKLNDILQAIELWKFAKGDRELMIGTLHEIGNIANDCDLTHARETLRDEIRREVLEAEADYCESMHDFEEAHRLRKRMAEKGKS